MTIQNKRMGFVCAGLSVCNVLVAATVQAQDVSFIAHRDFDVGLGPQSVAVGDFNGDGVLDLAVANDGRFPSFPGDVSVLLGNGDGSFQSPRNFAAGAGGCMDDTWTPTSVTVVSARNRHTAVWTGTEMIVWGGYGGVIPLNTGGRYDPASDSWTPTSTDNVPSERFSHTAVWTGSEMIVWGGVGFGGLSNPLNTGGRYNPATDSWTATDTTNAPSGRWEQTAIWTGSEMIIWGGGICSGGPCDGLSTGGRYDPATDSWAPTATSNAPSRRWRHTAVWTGTEMIVWGGRDFSHILGTGGRYDPATETWTRTSTTNAPSARYLHTAVWTASEMIVWGGGGSGIDGGRYDPATDSWTPTSTSNAPSVRSPHAAVWTDSEMIVWGSSGGRYDPATDAWVTTSTIEAPSPRIEHTAVWTGIEMIVWGGGDRPPLDTGGRYCAMVPGSP